MPLSPPRLRAWLLSPTRAQLRDLLSKREARNQELQNLITQQQHELKRVREDVEHASDIFGVLHRRIRRLVSENTSMREEIEDSQDTAAE